ncbi:MAG: hypothetical protein WA978_12175 [Sphingopyxis granuli]|uniref:hypothetical protein n=1 Tax=Sphingopyxis granuli TaxID=267128 RepID=UPI003C765CC8
MTTGFEADLDPATGAPRIRMNFVNGWSVSLVLTASDRGRTRFALASVAAAPTGAWGTGQTELLNNEAFADEVAMLVAGVSERTDAELMGAQA